jgi:O-antigen ligase
MSYVSIPSEYSRPNGGRAARVVRSLYAVPAGSLVATMFLPLAALLHQNFRRVLLAIVLLEVPFMVDVNLRFREETAAVGAIEGFNLSLTTVALVGLYLSWLIGFLVRDHSSARRLRMNWPLAFYVGFVALSMTSAYDLELAQFELFTLVQLFLLHVYVASSVRTRTDIIFVVAVLLIGLALEALTILATVGMGRSFAVGSIAAHIIGGRAGGTFGSPNAVASYLALLLAPCAGLVLANVSRTYSRLASAAFALGTISLIFTLSRGGWMAFALSMGLMGLAAWRRGYISLKGPLLVAVVVMLLVLPFFSLIAERIGGDDGGSAHSRIPLAILASRVIHDYPWLGLGPNNFALIEKTYVTSEFAGEWFFVVHNKYLLVWAETGLWALLAFLWFLGSTVRRGWRQWSLGDSILAPLALGFTAAIIGHMWHMFFDVFNSRAHLQTLWLISALIVAMGNLRADGDAAAADRSVGRSSR